MPVYEIAESLNSPDHGGNADAALNLQLEDIANRIVGGTAELSQQAAVKPEIDSQPLRYREYPLPMRGYRKNLIFEPVGKQQGAFLVARGATRTLAAGESDEKLFSTIRTSDSGKALLQVTALEKLVNGRSNDSPPEAILHPIALIVNTLELVNVIAHNLEEWRCGVVSVPIDLPGLDCRQGTSHEVSYGGPNQRNKSTAMPSLLDLS
jgi:hypothetical protein